MKPERKYRLGTVSNNYWGAETGFMAHQPSPSSFAEVSI